MDSPAKKYLAKIVEKVEELKIDLQSIEKKENFRIITRRQCTLT